ncbi:MAG: cytochrome c biogenesis protein CcsA [Cytophagaceae bacterium]|nr:cytochrome c biogenesis protein CcsA [Cytophagaceae bacterium]
MNWEFKIGDAGHLFVITAFISSILAAYAYWKNTTLRKKSGELDANTISWKKFARVAFYFHAASVIGVVTSLFLIIYNHRYEYYYAWDHSSNDLPTHYMISCFWEGQEGSFLLWIFWHVLLGLVLIKVNKTWEAPLMTIFCLVQAFLASMIIGVVIPAIELKLGSSPFILFKDQMADLPVFKLKPNYIPEDGSGLNALLQNYWMVIHPPTLFLGFASTLVPFAYCIAGLWERKYKEWVRPALPWALFSALILGTGILMGGYWAYETLNFGGYWNWDPVENAVYIPWLVLVASIHTMIAYKNSGNALTASVILTVLTFILILYSTFLTRSGILGSSSVHSFTDLGLSGQLLIYLLAFSVLSVVLMIIRWKEIPFTDKEAGLYSREFWIFIGVTVLCLAALQVLATTSIPVYNKIFGTNIAPPANQEEHYSNWQIWFAIIIAILSGVGQYFWWQKMDKEKIKNTLAIPFIISLLASSLIIYFGEISKVSYIILLTASIFSATANFIIFLSVIKGNYKLSGGSIAHMGIALMLIGILFSSGYSKIVSLNQSGVRYFEDVKESQDNVRLERGEPVKMGTFALKYQGVYVEAKNFPGYVPKEKILQLENLTQAIAMENISHKGKLYFAKGDTVNLIPENHYYRVEFENEAGEIFTLYPRVQINKQMGFVVSPDIQRFLGKDLYTHISSIPKLEEERQWSPPEEHTGKIKDTMFFNDHIVILDGIKKDTSFPGIQKDQKILVAKAQLRVLGKYDTYKAEPSIIVQDKENVWGVPYVIEDLGMRIVFFYINPSPDNPAEDKFVFQVSASDRDWIILKAIEKPMINVLWIGTLLLVLGLFIAIARRYSEFVKMRDKGVE